MPKKLPRRIWLGCLNMRSFLRMNSRQGKQGDYIPSGVTKKPVTLLSFLANKECIADNGEITKLFNFLYEK